MHEDTTPGGGPLPESVDIDTIAAFKVFLAILYGEEREGWLTLNSFPGKRTAWFPVGGEPPELSSDQNCYLGIGIRKERLASGRGTHSDVIGIPGFWLDLDFESVAGAHKGTKPLPPNEDACLDLLRSAPYQPSLIIHSGHGLQAYWIFNECWYFSDDAERDRAGMLCEGWQDWFKSEAGRLGWHVDSTGDLTRVMRIPGSFNCKVEPHLEVRIVEQSDLRYEPSDFDDWIAAPLLASKAAHDPHAGSAPCGDILKDSRLTDRVKYLIIHGDTLHKYASRSEAVFAALGALVKAGYSDDQICAALLNPEYRISHKPTQQGYKWVCDEIRRARSKQKPIDITNGTVGDDIEPVDDAPLSDVYNAARLVRKFGASIRYCGVWKKILVYHNGVWRTDHDGKVVEYAKAVARNMYDRAVMWLDEEKKKAATATVDPMSEEESESPLDAAKAYLKHAIKAHSAASIHNMIELAKSIDPLPISHDVLGTHHDLLSTLNCVIDLKTGAMLPHSQDYLFTGCVPVVFDPQAACPRWEQFLLELMGYTIGQDSPDDSKAVLDAREKADERARELVAYLKRVLGYCLTGLTKEQALFFFYGDGANGKSALFEILLKLLGDDFGKKGTANFLMVKKHDAHPTEQADLYRKRLVIVPETEKGARLSEVLVRELTGSDQITARHMNEDFWSFWPTHKFIIGTNHLPTFRDMSYAMRRRLQMVPFGVTFYDPDKPGDVPAHARDDPHTAWADKNLSVALLNELPGILAWIVQGAVEWYASGIQPPDEVLAATQGYFDSQDVVHRFIDDCCYTGDTMTADITRLWDTFRKWADDGNEQGRFTRTMFKEQLEAKGYQQARNKKQRHWTGIGLPAKEYEANDDKTHDEVTKR